jgi:SPP1 family predicted phage head-tail adaptor
MTKFIINAGKYRSIITIQQKNQTKDSFGQKSDVWNDFLKCRASISPISGKDYFSADVIQSETSHRVLMRYYPGITPDMRINYNGRTFIIQAIINFQELSKELQLYCKELA